MLANIVAEPAAASACVTLPGCAAAGAQRADPAIDCLDKLHRPASGQYGGQIRSTTPAKFGRNSTALIPPNGYPRLRGEPRERDPDGQGCHLEEEVRVEPAVVAAASARCSDSGIRSSRTESAREPSARFADEWQRGDPRKRTKTQSWSSLHQMRSNDGCGACRA